MAIQANNIKLSSKSLSLSGIASFLTPPYNEDNSLRRTSNPITKDGRLSCSAFHLFSASLTRLIAPTNHQQAKCSTLSGFFFTKWLITHTTIWRARYKLKSLVWKNLAITSSYRFLTRSKAFLHASTLHGFFDATTTCFILLSLTISISIIIISIPIFFQQTSHTNTSTPSEPLPPYKK